jgi:hypothetical protein
MSGTESAKRWIPAVALAFVVALLCAFVWYTSFNRSEPPAVAAPAKNLAPPAPDKDTAIEPVEGAKATREASTTAPPRPANSTSLRIHVVDAMTKAAVPGAKGFVEGATDTAHGYGSFETDADGRATVTNLPAMMLVVHVLRRPPHTSRYCAVDMSTGETRDVEVRLTAGGTVVGRAIDDAGKEVAGAEVSMGSERDDIMGFGATETWDAITKTGADGRFEIANVISRPIGVTLVDGELRAKVWTWARVRVQSGHSEAQAGERVTDGARIDLGDIVLPRGRSCAGRVLDAHWLPVEGALVVLTDDHVDAKWSAIPARAMPSNAALGDDRALSKSDGSFEIKSTAPANYASVTTKSGILEQFTLPDPKARRMELELVLKDWSILEIELADEQGARISSSPPLMHDKRVRMISAARQVAGDTGRLDATLVLDGKREIHQRFVADADGLFRFQTAGTSSATRRLHFELPGYLAVDEDIGIQGDFSERRKFTLHPIPSLRVHVVIDAQPDAKPNAGRQLLVQACMLDPQEFQARVDTIGIQCCGQGSIFTTALAAGEQDVELPVLAKGNYWLHAKVPSAKRNDKGEMVADTAFEAHIGPFATDGTSHDLKVPALEPMQPVESALAGLPASSAATTSISGRIVDSVTQKGIESAQIDLSSVPARTAMAARYVLGVDHEGNVRKQALRPATYELRMFVRKYHVPPAREVTVVEGQTLDLGTIALAPIPPTTLHVLEADGRAVPRGSRVELFVPGKVGTLVQARIEDDEGKVVLQSELGAGFAISVDEDLPQSDVEGMTGRQWLTHDFTAEQSEVELRLKKWRPIEVRIGGAIQEFPAAILRLQIAPIGIDPDQWGSTNMTEVLADSDGTRRFRAEVGGPMKLQIALRSALVQSMVQIVDIGEGMDLQTIAMTSAR